jgi:phospholipase C
MTWRARVATTLLALASALPATGPALGAVATDDPVTTTPIEHLVFLMQENHTFDNYFGTRPGVDGIPDGTCLPTYPDRATPCVEPFHIGDRGILDLDHSADAFAGQYNGGRMDGFVSYLTSLNKPDPALAMGYYDDRDLPYYWNIADEYVLFDRFFSSSSGGSVRNHMYRVTGSPGATGTRESIPEGGWGDIPTIFDRLEESGISWKFYVENYDPTITYRTRRDAPDADRGAQVIWVPLLAYARYLDDPVLNAKIVDLDEYYQDAAEGRLPAVAYIAPSGDSEHPPGSITSGQRQVQTLINTLMRSPQWASSAFIWSYDDWGGWYDHVAPPQVDEFGYGFRVPALLVSPYARRGHVEHSELDFTSVLKFIEENWGLEPLAARDRAAASIAPAFDFGQPPRPPAFLTTERDPTPPETVQAGWLYAGYTGVVVLVVTLVLTTVRLRRGPPEEDVPG